LDALAVGFHSLWVSPFPRRVLLSESGGTPETGARTFRVSSRALPSRERETEQAEGEVQALSRERNTTDWGQSRELLIFLYRYCHRCLTITTYSSRLCIFPSWS
jgi:hypothetical protein